MFRLARQPRLKVHSLFKNNRYGLHDRAHNLALKSSTFSSQAINGASPKLSKLVVGLGFLGLGGTYAYYKSIHEPRMNAPPVEIDADTVEFPRPSEDGHPYDREGQGPLARELFKLKRFCYLVLLFAPLSLVGAVSMLTGHKGIRHYYLDLLVSTLASAGCSFQKFGQWLSMRPDIFAPDVIEALATLRERAPVHSMKHTRKMIKESFGKEIEDVFEEFSDEPVASGTVAQVHRAKMRPEFCKNQDNRYVAVKVRHPHVLNEIWVDMDIIFSLVNNSGILIVPFSKTDFVKSLQQQVDLKWEAYNMHKFATNFQEEIKNGARKIKLAFPQVNRQFLSNEILIESWADGTTVADVFTSVGYGFKRVEAGATHMVNKTGSLCAGIVDEARAKLKDINAINKELALVVFDMNIKMFLRDNLCHADLHAGNLLFSKDDRTVTVLDAGLTSSLGADVKDEFGQFLRSICTGNIEQTVDHLLSFDERDPALVTPESRQKLTEDVDKSFKLWVADEVPGQLRTAPDGGPISIGDLVGSISFKLQKHGVRLRGDVASSLMTISVSEGLIRQLDPDFDIVSSALPYLVRFSGWNATKRIAGDLLK